MAIKVFVNELRPGDMLVKGHLVLSNTISGVKKQVFAGPRLRMRSIMLLFQHRVLEEAWFENSFVMIKEFR